LLTLLLNCNKGTTRTIFVDRKEYDGAIYRQIDDAYDFILRMIRMGAKINGIARQDVYEFPIGTIREMICNAVCHRSYFQPSHVQVALYDDRLEVTSPGMLSRDVSVAKMKEGFSKIRNRGIAKAFSYMKIIEGWGSGIPRMLEECKEYGLKEPELIDAEGDFRINLYRKDAIGISVPDSAVKVPDSAVKVPDSAVKVPDSAVKVPDKLSVPEQQKQILEYISANGQITSAQVEVLLSVKQRRARVILSDMIKAGLVMKLGASRNTRYVKHT